MRERLDRTPSHRDEGGSVHKFSNQPWKIKFGKFKKIGTGILCKVLIKNPKISNATKSTQNPKIQIKNHVFAVSKYSSHYSYLNARFLCSK
jgi:hypothetical protein